jgi:hypothetical protein
MRRFWKEVALEQSTHGLGILLDGRIKPHGPAFRRALRIHLGRKGNDRTLCQLGHAADGANKLHNVDARNVQIQHEGVR